MLRILKKIIPKPLFEFFQPAYHFGLALLGVLIYRFPSRKLTVIGVTGTKGKTTTTELVNSVLEAAGYKTAMQNTLRFKIGDDEKRNFFKMTMPGRFSMQKFLRDALREGCTHTIIEISSEGAKQFRHKFIYPDALIFTNLAPEHIESHGSYEKYVDAKISIAKELENKKGRAIIVNTDDKEGEKFLVLNIQNKIPYSLHDAVAVKTNEQSSSFQTGKLVIHSKLPGLFNVYNMLGVIAYARFAGILEEKIKKGLEKIDFVRGRMEKISTACLPAGRDFDVVIDYAHTPDSLKAVYETYNSRKKICVLGNTGGGRDKWKREEMGKIADKYCDYIILTNEDPYDEDPVEIVEGVKKGIKKKPCEIIMDRRAAINSAIGNALNMKETCGDKYKIAVLITGKGTDPCICGPDDTKQDWDDATVAREELQKVLKNKNAGIA
jgi:UDP-N-acetylmuramoyl-L-alanyl-D-glutamate--2,6-diaminopimelate ligase